MTIKVEVYDPKTEQFHAQVQGIYEYLVKSHLGLESSVPFKSKGKRLDEKHNLEEYVVRDLLSTAFAIATKVGQKHGFLKKGTNAPTTKGMARSAGRAGYDEEKIILALKKEGYSLAKINDILKNLPSDDREFNWDNLLDYEMTLALSRKTNFYRILKMKKERKTFFYLMPIGKEYSTLKEAQEGALSMQSKPKKTKVSRRSNPRSPIQMSQAKNANLNGSVVVSYETRRCNLDIKDLMKVKSLEVLFNNTKDLVGRTESFEEARAHCQAAVGRNMCKYCIIFVHTVNGKLLLADDTTGAMKTIDDLQQELRGQNAPRGTL
jgi:DNA-binding transcriptional MerR regulator